MKSLYANKFKFAAHIIKMLNTSALFAGSSRTADVVELRFNFKHMDVIYKINTDFFDEYIKPKTQF